MKDLLLEQLKKDCFDFNETDIAVLLNDCEHEDDGYAKMYNYIVDNNITDRDDVIRYGMKLSKCDNQIIEIEE